MPRITAAISVRPGEPLTFGELDLHGPAAREILVRTVASGVCHTDLMVRDGLFGPAHPVVIGHEGAGIVEAVGSSVERVAIGDHVLLTQAFCGSCPSCRAAHPMNCAHYEGYNLTGRRANGEPSFAQPVQGNFVGQSSFATYMLTYETNAVVLPKDLPLDQAAALGCGIATGASTVQRVLQPPAGASLLVVGVGAVGLAAVMMARALGCDPLLAVDLNRDRLQLASELGATHTIRGDSPDLADQIVALTKGGVRFAVDAVGSPATLENRPLRLRRPAGTLSSWAQRVSVSGSQWISPHFSSIARWRDRSKVTRFPIKRSPGLIALHRQGRFPFDRLLTHYDFADINSALADLDRGTVIKPVLRF